MRFRRTQRRGQDAAAGEDSFLDIVANLVGVLIILVVVVGAKAGTRIQEAVGKPAEDKSLTQLQEKHEKARRHARKLLRDNYQLEDKILFEQNLMAERNSTRNQLLVQVVSAKKELEKRKKELNVSQQDALDQVSELNALKNEFQTLDSEFTALGSLASQEESIEHFPTPIAKTVFNEEIHFRIRGGRIAYVPMNELTDRMQDEWKEKAKKLELADETLETVGPVGDFRLQYHLRAENRVVTTPYGEARDRFIEFTRFVMVPISDNIGDPMTGALTDGSDFRNWIDLLDPEKTTVSVWVYPDSFGQFNELKQWLYQRGFKTACWPLSQNSPISGGPSGYRSTAQ